MGLAYLTAFIFLLGFGSAVLGIAAIACLLDREPLSPSAKKAFGDALLLFSLLLSFALFFPPLHPYKGLLLFLFLGFALLSLCQQIEPSLKVRWLVLISLAFLETLFFIPLFSPLTFLGAFLFMLSFLFSLLWLASEQTIALLFFLILSLTFASIGGLSHQASLVGLGILMTGITAAFLVLRSTFPFFQLGETGVLVMGMYVAWLLFQHLLKTAFFLNIWATLLLFGFPLFSLSSSIWNKKSYLLNMRFSSVLDVLREIGIREKDIVRMSFCFLLFFCSGALFLFQLRSLPSLTRFAFATVWAGSGILVSLLLIVFTLLRYRPADKPTATILGFSFSGSGKEAILKQADEFIQSRKPHLVITPDSSSLYRGRQDKSFHKILQEADMLVPDGFGITLTARIFQEPIKERVAGVDLLLSLCDLAAKKSYRVFIYGGKPGVAEKAQEKLEKQFPSLQIVGTLHGYISDEMEVIAAIRQANPDILFVALGVPRQEKWMYRHLTTLQVPLSIGVGGSFDVISGNLKRAPLWLQRIGLEWLFRVWQEPWRIKRVWVILPFFLSVLKERFSIKKEDPQEGKPFSVK